MMLTPWKLKCDETKPFCLNCLRKGRTCGGYNRGFRFSRKHELNNASQTALAGSSSVPVAGDFSEVGDVIDLSATVAERHNTGSPTKSTTVEDPIESEPGFNLSPMLGAWTSGELGDANRLEGEYALWNSGHSSPGVSGNATNSSLALGMVRDAAGEEQNSLPLVGDAQHLDLSDSSGFIHQTSPTHMHFQLANLPMQQDIPHVVAGVPDSYIPPSVSGLQPFLWLEETESATGDFRTAPSVPQAVTHLPSLLISHWFKRICLIWSGYDSHLNLNRQIAAELWQDSEPVYNCLQSMSAACLSANIPHMRKNATSYLNNAVRAICTQQNSTASGSARSGRLAAAHVFALLCLGTSSSWIEAHQLGIPFFKAARNLADCWTSQTPIFSGVDNEQLTIYFDESLSYCEMLLAAVGSDYTSQLLRDRNEEPSLLTMRPHPWTGILPNVPRLFRRVMSICWKFQRHCKNPQVTTKGLQDALRLIGEAKSIHAQLVMIRTSIEAAFLTTSETDDERTPSAHFAWLAEAYRLASMLHLYQTFADVAAMRMSDCDYRVQSNRQAQWVRCITPVSLQLLTALRNIPQDSGTKIMQMFLYISASTGLRFHNMARIHGSYAVACETKAIDEFMGFSEYADRFDTLVSVHEQSVTILEQASLDVGEARGLILSCMNNMENMLPPKPVVVAKRLIQSIWTAYDSETAGNYDSHWIEVVHTTGLRSFFG